MGYRTATHIPILRRLFFSILAMQLMRTVLEMAMESGPARLAMIVAAIAFTQVKSLTIAFSQVKFFCFVQTGVWFTHVGNLGFIYSVVGA